MICTLAAADSRLSRNRPILKEMTMTDLERTVRAAIARIRELPADKLTITEIDIVEMLEAAVAKPAADPLMSLTGNPSGYVGYGERGVLTETVRRHPKLSVILLDEIEPNHPI
jgi:hypothetical protein